MGDVSIIYTYTTIFSIDISNKYTCATLLIFILVQYLQIAYTIVIMEEVRSVGNGTGKASTRAKNKYNAKTYDRVNLVLKKDTSPTKDQVQAAADAVGESLNSYIVGAISQRMQRDDVSSGEGGDNA